MFDAQALTNIKVVPQCLQNTFFNIIKNFN